jgi:type II secretory pathway component PulF
VPILQALDTVARQQGNRVIEILAQLLSARESIREGGKNCRSPLNASERFSAPG